MEALKIVSFTYGMAMILSLFLVKIEVIWTDTETGFRYLVGPFYIRQI